MSTLKVNTVQHNTSGFNNVVQFSDGAGTQNGTLCRAFVNFNGTGTVAIRDDFNVSSITDLGTGDYRVNFSNSLSNQNYCTVASVCSNGSINGAVNSVDIYSRSNTNVVTPDTSSYYLYVYHDNNSVAQDCVYICATTFAT